MKRLLLGLTDYERAQLDQDRRTRNCLAALGVLVMICGFIAAH